MDRRDFLKLTAALAVSTRALPLLGQSAGGAASAPAPHQRFDHYFLTILDGFLRNARATSPDFVVCDYPNGTKLKSCCNPAGRSYVSVARMLPTMVRWLGAKREPAQFTVAGKSIALGDVLLSIYRNAFDPDHPDFWGYAPSTRATQLSVEAALVAFALAGAGEEFVSKLTPRERTNINKWLASCTQVAERKTNHAWFSACNQAARLKLSRRFPEFVGDEGWMHDDLRAMDALGASSSADGWYTDSPDQPIYDVYNFYVFSNFPLMWGEIIGERYGEWNEKFRARVRTFLETTPYFFSAAGSHPLMGRSLIYRWAVLAPLVLGYREKLWPHSPGLLRRIVRGQLEYHRGLGCFDEARGKLRETFSRAGTDVTREIYVDNGHPYWTMLGFAFLGLSHDDPFWSVPEEPLPVEKDDFIRRFEGPRFLLSGTKRTGEVRWLMSQNSAKNDRYRDKYSKFVWSSHFGFNALTKDTAHVPPDQALVFREIETGKEATRASAGVIEGKLLDGENGVETRWFAQLGDWKFEVVSHIQIAQEFEVRTHQITAPAGAVGKVQMIEGAYAAALDADEPFSGASGGDGAGPAGSWIFVQPKAGAALTASRSIAGHDDTSIEQVFGSRTDVNLIWPRVAVATLRAPVSAATMTLASVHYASPRPIARDQIIRRGNELATAWKPSNPQAK